MAIRDYFSIEGESLTENLLEVFCRQIIKRSEENRRAIEVLHRQKLFGNMISILRQELDSMIRVIYLLSTKDLEYRNSLIQASVDGKVWIDRNSGKRITDREMVNLANNLQGWTQSVYKFGCAFIHLSSFHDYMARDPLMAISDQEKKDLLTHMRYYHGGLPGDNPTFQEVVFYLPMVFEKISSNLVHYVDGLKAEKTLSSL